MNTELQPKGPKYPNITVELRHGNAMMILAVAAQALKKGGVSKDEIEAFKKEALKKDYNHLLQTTLLWMNVQLT